MLSGRLTCGVWRIAAETTGKYIEGNEELRGTHLLRAITGKDLFRRWAPSHGMWMC
jgi:hypothetical protein